MATVIAIINYNLKNFILKATGKSTFMMNCVIQVRTLLVCTLYVIKNGISKVNIIISKSISFFSFNILFKQPGAAGFKPLN